MLSARPMSSSGGWYRVARRRLLKKLIIKWK
nr:MAG TPA: hypothetical protein [Caudoviricetes sp.]